MTAKRLRSTLQNISIFIHLFLFIYFLILPGIALEQRSGYERGYVSIQLFNAFGFEPSRTQPQGISGQLVALMLTLHQ